MTLNLSYFVARKIERGAASLLAVSDLISCKEARRIDAYALLWTPPSTSYTLLYIERPVYHYRNFQGNPDYTIHSHY
jgi:hypothetical protein